MKWTRWLAAAITLCIAGFVALTWLGTGIGAQATLVVDDDGQGSAADCDSGDAAYSTVQAAIDAASSGDTIVVCPGAYAESLTIGQSLSLIGAGSDVTFVTGGVQIQGTFDGLTLEGLYLTGDASGPKNAVIDSRPTTGPVTGVTIRDCVLDGENTSGRMAFYGHFIAGDWTLEGNEIKNFTNWYLIDNTGSQHDVPYKLDTVTWDGNHVHHVSGSVAIRGKIDDPTDLVVVRNSTFDQYVDNSCCGGWIWAAIEISNASDVQVYDNTITGVPTQGDEGEALQIWSATPWTVDIHDNVLTGNDSGIYIWGLLPGSDWSGPDTSLYVPGGSIYNNDISGNTSFGLWISDWPPGSGTSSAIGGPLNAKKNWWGDATGPAHSSNPHGGSAAGDAVSDNVDFTPWYATSTTTPTTQNVTVTHNPIIAYSDTIQGGIDAALSGDTVSVSTGTYEAFDVNKDGVTVKASSTPIISGTGISKDGQVVGVLVSAHDVTVQGLTIDGSFSTGIWAYNPTTPPHGAAIKDNTVDMTGYDPGALCTWDGAAIMAHAGSGAATVISGNVIDYASVGASEVRSQNGINVFGDNNADYTISRNTITDTTPIGNVIGGWKIQRYHQAINVRTGEGSATIEDNTITSDVGPMWKMFGIRLYGGDSDKAKNVTVEGNTVTKLAYALWVFGPNTDNILATENNFTGNDFGAVVERDAPGVEMHFNNISGNSSKGVHNGGTVSVDATGNWWGDVSGPFHATHNSDGTGDDVTDNVAYSPWLGIGTDASPDPGFQMVSPMTWVAGPAVCLAGSCIQKAVDFAASGDTIRVREGTFSEHVVVDGKNDLTIEDYGSPKPKVTVPPEATAPIIHVKNASNVTVEGLEVDGAGHGKTGCPSAGDPDTDQRFYGIRYSNSSGTVENNDVHGIKHPTGSQGCQSGLGIYAYQSSVQIIGNDVYDYQKNGITANLPGTSNIQGNTVTGSGPVGTGYAAQNGIQAGWDATATIVGNTVSNNSYTGSGWAATDILVQAADADVTGNILTDGYVGLYYILGSGMIAGNTISATTAGVGRTDYWGIAVSDPPGLSPSPFEDAPAPGGALPMSPGPGVMTVVVNGNTITGDGSAYSVGLEVDSGFYGDEDIDLEAAYNQISDWGYGIVTYACSGSCTSGVFLSVEIGPLNNIVDNDFGVGVYNDSSAIAVNFNNIVGNTTNGVESDDAAHTLDAENNWWGACDGPSGVGPGSGDAVSANVDYDPWIHGGCDFDADLLSDDSEIQVHGTEWQNPDTDGDGCADGEELLFTDPALGGLRDPLNPYDFYDITDISGVLGSKDQGVSGFDLNLLLLWGGAVNDGAPNANGKDYDADSNGNTIEDGEEMDFAGLAGPATGPDGGISGFDLNALLSQGGHSCAAPPP